MKALILTGCLAASLITGSDVRAEERPPLPPGFVLNTPDTPEHTTSIDPELVTFNSADQTVTFSRKAMEIFAAELKQVRHKAYCRGLLAGVWAAEATVKDYMRIRSEEGC
jgi:hypothetical protein